MKYDVGSILGGYELLQYCGQGAYGQVFLAKNALSGQIVALKIIAKVGTAWAREIDALIRYQNCRHPNLLQIYHVDQTDDVIYYTMECADNLGDSKHYIPSTLGNRIRQCKHLNSEQLLPMVRDLLDALDFLHRKKLIHRDVKPDNILFIQDRAVLGDIGLVNESNGSSFAGTFGFISDEVVNGSRSATPADDFYALGKVIYCALTGMDVKHYPDFNDSMTLSFHRGLVAVMLRTCRKPYISQAAALRKMLQSDGREIHQGRLPRRSLLLLVIFLGICGFALYHIFITGEQSLVKFRAAEVKETEASKETVLPQTPETTPSETKATETAPPQVKTGESVPPPVEITPSAKAAEKAPQPLTKPAIVIPVVTPEAPNVLTNSTPPPVTKIQSSPPKYSPPSQAEPPQVDWQAQMIEAVNTFDRVKFLEAKKHLTSLDFCDQSGKSLLMLAVDNGYSSFVEFLIRNGVNVNYTANGVPVISYALTKNNKTIIQALLTAKANVNQPDNEGKVPLVYAIQSNNHDGFSLLLYANADINASDNAGNTLLFYAQNNTWFTSQIKRKQAQKAKQASGYSLSPSK